MFDSHDNEMICLECLHAGKPVLITSEKARLWPVALTEIAESQLQSLFSQQYGTSDFDSDNNVAFTSFKALHTQAVKDTVSSDSIEFVCLCANCLDQLSKVSVVHVGWRYQNQHSPFSQYDDDGYLINPHLPADFFYCAVSLRPPMQTIEWWDLPFIRGNEEDGYSIYVLDGEELDRPTWKGYANTLEEAREVVVSLGPADYNSKHIQVHSND
ncbi:hypothetical protein [Ferrimonas aestuarii]|uniref:Uncharacterized protein n=1 Tax=Ferrimonas aestuarii TaxID=2569539 RepID=A0A4U1BY00_9GAMM|nr:hypothetical protein [Ferrimonas aestuarii]TKB58615.1 hypothetical protein FCL42_02380 [Ferrimonas aestuarii]